MFPSSVLLNFVSCTLNKDALLQLMLLLDNFTLLFFQIPLEAVQSLSLLLEGSACQDKAVQPVHMLLTKDPLQTQAGYSPLSRSFDLNNLLSCLQQTLTLNPFGITACLKSGRKLAWAPQGVLGSFVFFSFVFLMFK